MNEIHIKIFWYRTNEQKSATSIKREAERGKEREGVQDWKCEGREQWKRERGNGRGRERQRGRKWVKPNANEEEHVGIEKERYKSSDGNINDRKHFDMGK